VTDLVKVRLGVAWAAAGVFPLTRKNAIKKTNPVRVKNHTATQGERPADRYPVSGLGKNFIITQSPFPSMIHTSDDEFGLIKL
jgi:hypothetical protein